VETLELDIACALRSYELDVRLSVGAETVGNTPEEFAAFIRSERVKYAQIVKAANIKLD